MFSRKFSLAKILFHAVVLVLFSYFLRLLMEETFMKKEERETTSATHTSVKYSTQRERLFISCILDALFSEFNDFQTT